MQVVGCKGQLGQSRELDTMQHTYPAKALGATEHTLGPCAGQAETRQSLLRALQWCQTRK